MLVLTTLIEQTLLPHLSVSPVLIDAFNSSIVSTTSFKCFPNTPLLNAVLNTVSCRSPNAVTPDSQSHNRLFLPATRSHLFDPSNFFLPRSRTLPRLTVPLPPIDQTFNPTRYTHLSSSGHITRFRRAVSGFRRRRFECEFGGSSEVAKDQTGEESRSGGFVVFVDLGVVANVIEDGGGKFWWRI